ncbi:hypothetical protein JG688_00006866, partial [Phytophthora aleatoria]
NPSPQKRTTGLYLVFQLWLFLFLLIKLVVIAVRFGGCPARFSVKVAKVAGEGGFDKCLVKVYNEDQMGITSAIIIQTPVQKRIFREWGGVLLTDGLDPHYQQLRLSPRCGIKYYRNYRNSYPRFRFTQRNSSYYGAHIRIFQSKKHWLGEDKISRYRQGLRGMASAGTLLSSDQGSCMTIPRCHLLEKVATAPAI